LLAGVTSPRSRFCSAGPDGDRRSRLVGSVLLRCAQAGVAAGKLSGLDKNEASCAARPFFYDARGMRVGSEKGGNAGSNRAASGGIVMGYGREETVYPAGLVCGGWRSATATARSSRTSARFSWHDFLSNVSRYRQNGWQ
jgi:hypothetical protein